MNVIKIYRTLGPVDMKNIRRDSMLVWIPLIPLMIALVLRIGMPGIADLAAREFEFDLREYYPLVMSGFMMLAPMLVGFLLLDERDDRTLSALLVTPMPIMNYLLYRITLPMGLGIVMTLFAYPLAGLGSIPAGALLMVVFLGAFVAPMMALFLAAFAENKVSGFALMKMVNGLMMIPTVSYFIKSDWQALVGVIPTYWANKLYWLAAEGNTGSTFVLYFAAGLVVNGAALAVMLKRFHAVMHR
ncbi:MAG: hypothetical protein KJ064_16655 [Anaerolineae bacterium]|nr:hypothetical protein [Anaerolineae bacterium]